MANEDNRFARLEDALKKLTQYDLILIDCPPSLGMLTLNALCASRSVLIPMQCEYFALEGMSQLIRTIEMVKSGPNPNLAIEGVLLTMYDGRNNLARQVAQDVREHFSGRVFEAVIPRNVRLSEAPSFGKPIILYDATSRGCLSYMELAQELISSNSVQAA